MSIDTIHKPGSTTEERHDAGRKLNPLQLYKFKNGQLVREVAFKVSVAGQNEAVANKCEKVGQLKNLLYNLENLRKRKGEGQDE